MDNAASLTSAGNLTPESLTRVITVLTLYTSLWGVGLFLIFSCAMKHRYEVRKEDRKMKKVSVGAGGVGDGVDKAAESSVSTQREVAVEAMLAYVSKAFPAVFRSVLSLILS